MLDENKKKELAAKIDEELSKVEGELRSVGRINPENPADWEPVPEKRDVLKADSQEVADSIDAYEENTAILKQLEIRLNELKAAKKRMADGTYGKCGVCGKPIKIERLEANPAAANCMDHS